MQGGGPVCETPPPYTFILVKLTATQKVLEYEHTFQ